MEFRRSTGNEHDKDDIEKTTRRRELGTEHFNDLLFVLKVDFECSVDSSEAKHETIRFVPSDCGFGQKSRLSSSQESLSTGRKPGNRNCPRMNHPYRRPLRNVEGTRRNCRLFK